MKSRLSPLGALLSWLVAAAFVDAVALKSDASAVAPNVADLAVSPVTWSSSELYPQRLARRTVQSLTGSSGRQLSQKFSAQSTASKDSLDECVICFESVLEDPSEPHEGGCSAKFHQHCLKDWYKNSKGDKVCPFCQKPTPGSEDELPHWSHYDNDQDIGQAMRASVQDQRNWERRQRDQQREQEQQDRFKEQLEEDQRRKEEEERKEKARQEQEELDKAAAADQKKREVADAEERNKRDVVAAAKQRKAERATKPMAPPRSSVWSSLNFMGQPKHNGGAGTSASARSHLGTSSTDPHVESVHRLPAPDDESKRLRKTLAQCIRDYQYAEPFARYDKGERARKKLDTARAAKDAAWHAYADYMSAHFPHHDAASTPS